VRGLQASGSLVSGISFKLVLIFHLGVLTSQRPITLGYPAPAIGERRHKRSFGLLVCKNRTCGVVRVIYHSFPLWRLRRAGSYDASLFCATFKRAAMVSHSAARSNKTRRPTSSESARASHRQRAAWCNRSASFACFILTPKDIFASTIANAQRLDPYQNP
jgi:hypothetical protein